jgi:hypothetical protein
VSGESGDVGGGESRRRGRRIDWRQVRALVRSFLIMSLRTMPIRTMRGEKSSSGKGALLLVLGLFTLFGMVLSTMASRVNEVFLYSFVLHLMTLFAVGTSAMNEASEVLFSTAENDVLLHRPIRPATLVLSKAITILSFTLVLAAALNLFPTFTLLSIDDARPWAPLVHMGSILLSTVFASATVISMYGLVARLLGRERFHRVITAAQIASTLFLACGFQLVPRLIGPDSGVDVAGWLESSSAVWLIPPCWFAALDAWLGSGATEPRLALLALTGLFATLGCAWVGVLRLPSTGANAASVLEESRKDVPAAAQSLAPDRGLIERLVSPWLRDPIERASFRLAKAYLLRERTVKVRLAATLSFYLVIPLMTLTSRAQDGFMPLMFFWMVALVPVTVLEVLRISPNPAAADLFLYSPLDGAARVFHGVRKATIVLVQLPILVYIAAVAAWALRDEPRNLFALLPALLVMPVTSLLPGLLGDYLPLSMVPRSGQRTAQSLLALVAMVPAMGLGFVTWLALENDFLWTLFAIAAPLAIGLHWLVLRIVDARARSAHGARCVDAAWK